MHATSYFRFIPKLFVLGLICFNLGSCKPGIQYSENNPACKPNVLLIMTDDQGWGDFGINGNDSINTPVLNKLATESFQFDRFYVSPVCAPTRASLLTGRYHLRTGTTWVTHRMEVMREDELSIAEILKSKGYVTGCFGKWHNGEQYPNNAIGQGFDEFIGFSAGHWNNYFNTSLDSNGVQINTIGYISDVLTRASISFITRNKDRPFFCYVPYNAPHSPFQVPEKYFRKYKELGFSDKNACVYAMCENIDENIGKILNTLDSLKLRNNTIVIFLTDNGPNGIRYNGGMKGRKGSVDEGGIRVPLFIRYPAKFKKSSRIVKEITAHIDILPTIAELCGIAIPDSLKLDGVSLVPLMQKSDKGFWNDRNIFTHQVHRSLKKTPGSVRNSRYRLVFYENRDTLLYDMIKDPGQNTNIAKSSQEIVKELLRQYNTWYEDVTQDYQGIPPIPVGFLKQAVAVLPAPEASLSGSLKFKGGMGWANDWITNWKNPEDKVEWKIDVEEAADFEVSIQYALKEENCGTILDMTINDKTITKKLTLPQPAKYIPSPDRVVRGEVYEREWYNTSIGMISLPAGIQTIRLQAIKIPGTEAIELKSLTMKRLR